MRLGIDFGTTHTVVSLVDRGNYPVVGFEWGDVFPSMIAARAEGGDLRFGHDAALVDHDPDWIVVRSLKRLLARSGPLTEIAIGPHRYALPDLLAGHFLQLRRDLIARSNAGARRKATFSVAASIPANASNNQRFMTLDAFRRAGFEVVALLNEPSAAGFEYAHRFRGTVTSRREYVLVYDLGGGTFDSSLIHMAGPLNEVVTSAGVSRLGGNDMDEAILSLVLEKTGRPAIDSARRGRLLQECRIQKEAVGPQTRRMVIDLEVIGREPVVLPIEEAYTACKPLVEQSLETMEEALRDPRRDQREAVGWSEIASIYVVGGASGFPLVPRRLKERFGAHRVRRSPHPFAATAIGLATFLDEGKGFELADCLTRHFGVWREADTGAEVIFDPIFQKDARLPKHGAAPLEAVRRYRSAHNLGHFRFVECDRIREGRPDGDVVPWEEIRFPFDPSLRDMKDLAGVSVVRDHGYEIEERYRCTSTGIFEVTVRVPEHDFSRHYVISRSGRDEVRRPLSLRQLP
ncbi:MAG: Hsp70 family protein [Vicinamibacteria bacterium]|nr:Hsp70 family protein [Vicinamibacteria bacterium]